MNKLKLPMLVAMLGAASVANADINFRGFGSIVGGQGVSLKDGENIRGYSDYINFKKDSLMALQMDADLDEGLSATAQFMSRGISDFNVNVEWAYLTYKFTDDFQVSAGRIRAPFYRYSDFLDVRYAYNWITAPARVYSFEFPGFDGISMLYNKSIGSVDSTFQVYGGSINGPVSYTEDTAIEITSQVGVSWLGSWEWLTGRASYVQSKVSVPLDSLEGIAQGYGDLGNGMLGISQQFALIGKEAEGSDLGSRAGSYSNSYALTGAALASNAENIRMSEDAGKYAALGLAVDKGSFIAEAEWIGYEVENAFSPKTTAYFVTLGWRIGAAVVYGTYSREEGDTNTDFLSAVPDLSLVAAAIASDAELGGAAPELSAAAVGVVASTEGLRQSLLAEVELDVVNTEIGMRWDFHPSAALKIAYERQDDKINNTQGGLFRTAIDFVF